MACVLKPAPQKTKAERFGERYGRAERQRGESARVLSLHNSPAEMKNPYCANSIRGKQKEKERAEEQGWRKTQTGRRGLGSPAVCEKAAVAY